MSLNEGVRGVVVVLTPSKYVTTLRVATVMGDVTT